MKTRPIAGRRGSSFTRREFLTVGATGIAGVLAACKGLGTGLDSGDAVALESRPGVPTRTVTPGLYGLGLDSARDAQLFVPAVYEPSRAIPLVVLLHGAGQHSNEWANSLNVINLLDEFGVAMLAPSSRGLTWYPNGPDVDVIDEALSRTFDRLNVDANHVALGGFSDGASVGLSLGLANGDLFPQLLGFSPGYLQVARTRGTPRIFVAHGQDDRVLSYNNAVSMVDGLRGQGYDVEFAGFEGGHVIRLSILRQSMEWFLRS